MDPKKIMMTYESRCLEFALRGQVCTWEYMLN
jgi:hypothetical protein